MKCPFRKIIKHIREVEPLGHYTKEETFESFDDCIEKDCRAWYPMASSADGPCRLMSIKTPKF